LMMGSPATGRVGVRILVGMVAVGERLGGGLIAVCGGWRPLVVEKRQKSLGSCSHTLIKGVTPQLLS
jgi:hypothetical protein